MARSVRPAVLPHQSHPAESTKVSIIVLNWNAVAFLRRALDSIVRFTTEEYQLIVIDNGSRDGSKAYIRDFIRRHPAVDTTFIDNKKNLYFSRAYNQGFKASSADAPYALVFCNDVEVKGPWWLREMIAGMQSSDAVAVGDARTVPVQTYQREIYVKNNPSYHIDGLRERMDAFFSDPGSVYKHISGFCFMVRKSLLARTGLYLEGGDFKQYHSDWEWYARFKVLGHRVRSILPRVHHWHSVSELVAFYPNRYRELVERISDPSVLADYLTRGRPLYPEESGYRARQRPRRDDGNDESAD